MITLIEPVTHRSDRFGWAGWIHWETSGAHFYAWETPQLFFSVDVYTCKPFDEAAAVRYTERCFAASDIVAQGF
jgi:S-adenosylmethionine decarboxylase